MGTKRHIHYKRNEPDPIQNIPAGWEKYPALGFQAGDCTKLENSVVLNDNSVWSIHGKQINYNYIYSATYTRTTSVKAIMLVNTKITYDEFGAETGEVIRYIMPENPTWDNYAIVSGITTPNDYPAQYPYANLTIYYFKKKMYDVNGDPYYDEYLFYSGLYQGGYNGIAHVLCLSKIDDLENATNYEVLASGNIYGDDYIGCRRLKNQYMNGETFVYNQQFRFVPITGGSALTFYNVVDIIQFRDDCWIFIPQSNYSYGGSIPICPAIVYGDITNREADGTIDISNAGCALQLFNSSELLVNWGDYLLGKAKACVDPYGFLYIYGHLWGAYSSYEKAIRWYKLALDGSGYRIITNSEITLGTAYTVGTADDETYLSDYGTLLIPAWNPNNMSRVFIDKWGDLCFAEIRTAIDPITNQIYPSGYGQVFICKLSSETFALIDWIAVGYGYSALGFSVDAVGNYYVNLYDCQDPMLYMIPANTEAHKIYTRYIDPDTNLTNMYQVQLNLQNHSGHNGHSNDINSYFATQYGSQGL